MKFQTEHLATLAKYAGISFVAGAVNHGFFSERRSFVTAGVGVMCFLIGAAMEMKAAPDGTKRWADLLVFGIVASIGLGFFTGGLQHFPDSPGRSLWVVPLGFFLSLGAVYLSEGRSRIAPKPLAVYTLATGASVIAGSVVAASYWDSWVVTGMTMTMGPSPPQRPQPSRRDSPPVVSATSSSRSMTASASSPKSGRLSRVSPFA